MNRLTKFQIWWNKEQCKKWYLRLCDAEYNTHGGLQMKEMISSNVKYCKEKTNHYVRKLQILDPDKAPAELP